MNIILFKEFKERWFELLLASMIIGLVVSVFIIERSVTKSAEDEMHKLSHTIGKNMLVVPKATKLADFYAFKYGNDAMPQNYPDLIKGSNIAAHIGINQPVLYGNITQDSVQLVIAGHDTAEKDRSESAEEKNWAVLGIKAAHLLKLQIGSTLTIKNIPLQVVNILGSPPQGLDTGVFTSLKTAQEILRKPGAINAIYMAGCWCSLDIPALASQVESILPGTKAITIAGMAKAQKGIVAVMQEYSHVFYAIAIILIAGTIFVLILSQLQRYSREFALFLAIGMQPASIILTFVKKSVVIASAGTLIGFIAGIPLTIKLSSHFLGSVLIPSYEVLLTAFILSLVFSAAGAIFSASQITHFDPAKTLREA